MEFTVGSFQNFLGRKVRKFNSKLLKETAVSLLNETTKNPGPPIDTGRLFRSGTAYIGQIAVASNGEKPNPKHYDLPGSSNIATIVYSTPKRAGDKANVYYVFAGTKWFDYAEYQHRNHAIHAFWVRNATRGMRMRHILMSAKRKALEAVS